MEEVLDDAEAANLPNNDSIPLESAKESKTSMSEVLSLPQTALCPLKASVELALNAHIFTGKRNGGSLASSRVGGRLYCPPRTLRRGEHSTNESAYNLAPVNRFLNLECEQPKREQKDHLSALSLWR